MSEIPALYGGYAPGCHDQIIIEERALFVQMFLSFFDVNACRSYNDCARRKWYHNYYEYRRREGTDMKKLPQISEAELEVMRIVWGQAPVSTNEITDKLVRSTDWSPKTIQTLIRRLVAKGALTYEKQGRMFVYTAAVGEDEYLRAKSISFIEHYFNGDISAFVSLCLESDALSQEKIESLRKIFSKTEKNEKSC